MGHGNSNSDDLLTVDYDIVIMKGEMTEEEILQEICENKAIEEEVEDKKDKDNENEIVIKLT